VPNTDVVTVATDAGMMALWRGTAFAHVDGYEAWEERVNDRLAEAIRSGDLVPIGIQGDGTFGVRVAGRHATQASMHLPRTWRAAHGSPNAVENPLVALRSSEARSTWE
jgi:hypothetical protein